MDIGVISDSIDDYSGGIGVYTYHILKNLSEIDDDNCYHLIHHSHNDSELYKKNKEIIIPQNRFLKRWGGYILWRYLILPLKLKNYSLDLLHDPYELGPTSLKQPFRKVITIHDLTPLLFPKLFKNVDVFLHRLLLKKTIEEADQIITVSNHSKQDILRYFNVPKEKIRVIYNGKEESFKPIKNDELRSIKEKYGLIDDFILFVGGIHPIKNIKRLLKAFQIAHDHGIKHKLVIVGGVVDRAEEIFQTIKTLGIGKEVIFTGKVTNKDLVGIYNAANLFVYPCLYAGFGLPPLEAMSCGTPVITSNNSSLPEVVGDAAILVDPYKPRQIAEEILNLTSNDEMKQELIKNGLKQSENFNWKDSASKTLDIYKEVIKNY